MTGVLVALAVSGIVLTWTLIVYLGIGIADEVVRWWSKR